jgi:hypothetical protein
MTGEPRDAKQIHGSTLPSSRSSNLTGGGRA